MGSILASPLVFQGLDGELVGLVVTLLCLSMHGLVWSGPKTKDMVARQELDLKHSSQGLMTSVLTFAFLISALKENNERTPYMNTKEGAKAWLVSMVLLLFFYVPDPIIEEAETINSMRTILVCYSIGFFISGIVHATS